MWKKDTSHLKWTLKLANLLEITGLQTCCFILLIFFPQLDAGKNSNSIKPITTRVFEGSVTLGGGFCNFLTKTTITTKYGKNLVYSPTNILVSMYMA